MTPTVTVLIPDLDGELNTVLRLLEETLLVIESIIDDPDMDWWTPPAGLDAPAADAVGAVDVAIGDGGERPGRIFAPDGIYEHNPLRAVALDPADIDRIGAAIRGLGQGGAARDEVISDVLDGCAGDDRRVVGLVEQAARLHGLLDTPPSHSARLLASQLGDGRVDVVLDQVGEVAYQTVVARIMKMWHGDDRISRFLY